jgi:hypothetical protein
MRPGAQVGTSPRRMCRSVPQMVVFVILTIASVGFSMRGAGWSSSAFWPGPWYTSAFMMIFESLVSSRRFFAGSAHNLQIVAQGWARTSSESHMRRTWLCNTWTPSSIRARKSARTYWMPPRSLFEATVTSNAREGMAIRQILARRKGIRRASYLTGGQFERGEPHRP